MTENRVREYISTTGTGPLWPAGPVAGYVAFSAVIPAGGSFTYCLEDGYDFEIGEAVREANGSISRVRIDETLVGGVHTAIDPPPLALSGQAEMFVTLSKQSLAALLAERLPTHDPSFTGVMTGDTLRVKVVDSNRFMADTNIPPDDVFDLEKSLTFLKNIENNHYNFSIINPPNGYTCFSILFVTTLNPALPPPTFTWPSSVRWPSGEAFEPLRNGAHEVVLSTYNNGITWLAKAAFDFAAPSA